MLLYLRNKIRDANYKNIVRLNAPHINNHLTEVCCGRQLKKQNKFVS